MTAFMGIKQLEDQIMEIHNKYSRPPDKTALGIAKRTFFKNIPEYIENLNIVAENAIRLSTFKHLRDHYLSLSKDPTSKREIRRVNEMAALAVRDLTVDFNQGGELKHLFNGLHPVLQRLPSGLHGYDDTAHSLEEGEGTVGWYRRGWLRY